MASYQEIFLILQSNPNPPPSWDVLQWLYVVLFLLSLKHGLSLPQSASAYILYYLVFQSKFYFLMYKDSIVRTQRFGLGKCSNSWISKALCAQVNLWCQGIGLLTISPNQLYHFMWICLSPWAAWGDRLPNLAPVPTGLSQYSLGIDLSKKG